MSDPFFDTNIVIDWLNRQPKARAELLRYRRHRISRIVWTEVLAGEALEHRENVQQIISAFEVVEVLLEHRGLADDRTPSRHDLVRPAQGVQRTGGHAPGFARGAVAAGQGQG